MQKFDIMDIIMWLIVAAIIVLIVMNAKDFATAVTAVGNSSNQTLGVLSGQGYKPLNS